MKALVLSTVKFSKFRGLRVTEDGSVFSVSRFFSCKQSCLLASEHGCWREAAQRLCALCGMWEGSSTVSLVLWLFAIYGLILKTLEEVACYFGAVVEGVDALKELYVVYLKLPRVGLVRFWSTVFVGDSCKKRNQINCSILLSKRFTKDKTQDFVLLLHGCLWLFSSILSCEINKNLLYDMSCGCTW